MCADKRVPVEFVSAHQNLAGAFLRVSDTAGPKLGREQGAVWMSVGFACSFGVRSPLAVVVKLWQRDWWPLLVLSCGEFFGLLCEH